MAALGNVAISILAISVATPAFAEAATIHAADTAWMIVATALVLMMTIPGLALFYSGMVRKKNVLATMAQSLGGASGGLGGRPDAVLGLSCCLRSAGSCSSIAAWRAPAIGCPIQIPSCCPSAGQDYVWSLSCPRFNQACPRLGRGGIAQVGFPPAKGEKVRIHKPLENSADLARHLILRGKAVPA